MWKYQGIKIEPAWQGASPSTLLEEKMTQNHPPNYLPVLFAMVKQTKNYKLIDGKLDKVSYGNACNYRPVYFDVQDIHQLSFVLTELESQNEASVVRGELTSSALDTLQKAESDLVVETLQDTMSLSSKLPTIRRTFRDTEEAKATFKDCQRSWLMFDIDELETPSDIDLSTAQGRQEAISLAVSLLPPEFHDVTFHYQWSSSAGVKNWDTIKLHLWFWLSQPLSSKVLKSWAKSWTLNSGFKVDLALFHPIQVHYTSEPVFTGIVNPLQGCRSGIIDKAKHSADLSKINFDLFTQQEIKKKTKPVQTTHTRLENSSQRNKALDSIFGLSLQELSKEFAIPKRPTIYGDYLIKKYTDRLAKKQSGESTSRHAALFLSAQKLGQLLPNGYTSFSNVKTRLMQAAQSCGYIESTSHEKASEQIQQGINSGLKYPFGGYSDEPSFLLQLKKDKLDFVHLAAQILSEHDCFRNFDGEIVQVKKNDEEIGLKVLSANNVYGLLLTYTWYQMKKVKVDGVETQEKNYVDLPNKVTALYAQIAQRLRFVRSIAHRPVVNERLEVSSLKQGYCPKTQDYFKLAPTFLHTHAREEQFAKALQHLESNEISTDPQVAQSALGCLINLFIDFPFQEPKHRVLAVSAIFSALLRPILNTCPSYVVKANLRGTGKSKLLKTVLNCIYGKYNVPFIPWRTKRDEQEKTLVAALLNQPHELLFDNATGVVGWEPLDAAITDPSGKINIRRLGKSEMQTVPFRAFVAFTGNNIRLGTDLDRRSIIIPLVSPIEKPEERQVSDFKHPDIEAYAIKHAPLVWICVLTIIKSFQHCTKEEQDRVQSQCMPNGSFEMWSKLVQQPLYWVTELSSDLPATDIVLLSRSEMDSETDNQQNELFNALKEWQKYTGDTKWWTANKLHAAINVESIAQNLTLITQLFEKKNVKQISHALSKLNNVICQNQIFKKRRNQENMNEYQLSHHK